MSRQSAEASAPERCAPGGGSSRATFACSERANSLSNALRRSSSRTSRAASASLAPCARSSAYRSSMCCANSSAISCSRSARRPSWARRSRTSLVQSGTGGSDDLADGVHELEPALALLLHGLAAGGGDVVVAAATLPRLLDPFALDPSALFHAIEQRIERRHLKLHDAAGARLDELAQLVA